MTKLTAMLLCGAACLVAMIHAGEGPAAPPQKDGFKRLEYVQPIMGTQFRIVVWAQDEGKAEAAAQAAFDRVVQLDEAMSDYKESSELMRLCKGSGGPATPVSADLFDILKISKDAGERSHGAFDITVGPLVRLWRLSRRNHELPPAGAIEEAKTRVGIEHLVLDEAARTARLTLPRMLLDLGGVAKGYAAEKALDVLKEKGFPKAMAVGGGEMALGDAPPDKTGWMIGIAPLEGAENAPKVFLLLTHAAVSTSGDAEQFVEIDGKRYSHILDPKTGYGLTGHSQATVVAPHGWTSDWLATAIEVMGAEEGLKLAEALDGVAVQLSVSTPDGKKTFESKRWKDVPRKQ